MLKDFRRCKKSVMGTSGRAGFHSLLHSLLATYLSCFMHQSLLSFSREFNSLLCSHERKAKRTLFVCIISAYLRPFLQLYVLKLLNFLPLDLVLLLFAALLWSVGLMTTDVSIILALFSSF